MQHESAGRGGRTFWSVPFSDGLKKKLKRRVAVLAAERVDRADDGYEMPGAVQPRPPAKPCAKTRARARAGPVPHTGRTVSQSVALN